MEPGTLGVWDGERWAPAENAIRSLVRAELATHLAAALADPDLGYKASALYEEGRNYDAFRAASQALARYLLERLTAQEQQILT